MPPKKSLSPVKPAPKGTAKPTAKNNTTTTNKAPSNTKTGAVAGKGTALKKTSTAAVKGKPKGKEVASKKPKAPVWTEKDDHARTIQKYVRRHLAQKKFQKLKKKKQDYDILMEKLQKEAWLKIVQMEREQAELERKKEEEERRKRREEIKRQSRILEAAFDGDNDEILAALEEAFEEDSKQTSLSETARQSLIIQHQFALIDCKDANNNTPLSEAAGGGHVDTISMLIQKGACVNSRGRYKRTPLWRAAFGGHLQAVQALLEQGGDLRLIADDGTNALQVAAIDSVKKVLEEWDISQTDILLEKIDKEQEKRSDEAKKRLQAECNRLEEEIKKAEKEHQACQKELKKVHEELNKRIFEHDQCMNEGKTDKKDITLQAIHDAEDTLELVKIKSETAQKKLAEAKLKLREQAPQEKQVTENIQGIKVMIKDLDDVLLRDVGGKIAADGRWPLMIDPSSQVSTFLRYRDTNYINALSQRDVHPEALRIALLGAIRYGKPMVVDMMEIDLFDTLVTRFNEVQIGLLSSIMSKSILKDNKFLELVHPGDGEEYSKTAFLGARIECFSFIIITQQWNPPDHLMKQTYPIRVIIPSLPDN